LNPNYVIPGSSELGQKFQNDPFSCYKGSSMDPKFIELRKKEEQKKEADKKKTLKETVKD
jgi:hypothetical protein